MQYYLKHHGILGQKWGKRNGPPYPLGAEDHSAAEKKAAKGYTKELNSIDQKRAKQYRHYAQNTNAAYEYGRKIEKAKQKDKDYSKYEEKKKQFEAKAKPFKDQIDKYDDETKKILNEIEKSGIYDVKMKNINRIVNEPQDYAVSAVATAASYGLASALGLPVFLINVPMHNVPGTNYKVKKKSDEQIAQEKKEKEDIKMEANASSNNFKVDKNGWASGEYKKGKDKISITGFTDDGFDKETSKMVADKYFRNKKDIKDSAMKAILNDDNLANYWVKEWSNRTGKSKNDFYNNLDIKSVYVSPGGNVEISVWEKDDSYDLLGGHTIDIEMDLNNPKKIPKYISMNG